MSSQRAQPILVVYFVLGFASLIVQATLIREFLVVFYGNELCLGVILASWLLWIAIGARIGVAVAARTQQPWGWFLAFLLLGALAPPGQVVLIRLVRTLLQVPVGEYVPFLPMLGFAAAVIAPFSFMIGITFPLGSRLLAGGGLEDAQRIGWIWIVESLGSLAGGVVFTFYLVARYPSCLNLGLILAAIVLTASALALQRWAGPRAGKIVLGGAVALLLAGLFPLLTRVERASVAARWKSINPHLPLLISTDSKYENIVLTRQAGQYSVFGNGQYMFPFPDEYGYATKANLVLSEHPRPQRVLLLGGGVGGLLRAMLQTPGVRVDYAELDRQLIETLRPYLPPEDQRALQDERVRVFYTDGRFLVKQTSAQYDLVFADLPDPATAMLNRFYTREFFREVKAILRPGGVFALHLTAAPSYLGELVGGYNASIYRTLREVFPYLAISPGDLNYYFAALEPGVVTADYEELARRFEARGVQTDYFFGDVFYMYFQPSVVEYVERTLEQMEPQAQLNTDLRPITYFYNLLLWDRFSGSHIGPFFRWLERLSLGWPLLLLGLFVGLWLIYRRWRKLPPARDQQFSCLFAVVVCGLAAMAFEIVLLFAFQNLWGYLYQQIGLIVALFMFGLAAGALAVNLLLVRIRRPLQVFMGLELAIALFGLLLPPGLTVFAERLLTLLPAGLGQALFSLAIIVSGVLTGAEFPLASAIMLRTGLSTERTAGLVDGADHFGAFCGALLAGTVLVPVLGLVHTCWLIAALAGTAAVLLSLAGGLRPFA